MLSVAARNAASLRLVAATASAAGAGGLAVAAAYRKSPPTLCSSAEEATSGGGGPAGFGFLKRRLTRTVDDHGKLRYDPKDVFLPTLQAAVRALNLARTAVQMAVDYKAAAIGCPDGNCLLLLRWNPSHEEEKEDARRSYWEKETERRRAELREAQDTYSKRSHPHLTDHERFEAKKHEKERMNAAALSLGEAEEELAAVGSRASRVHKRAARRLLKLCQENGGVYIKIGQHLANLDYLIPQEYIETLSELFDGNPATSYEDVREVVREELGSVPEQLFDDFESEPIASASLAQVHVAYEKETGRKLAVKVQHRGLRETSVGDIYALVKVVRTAERLFEGFKWGWLADEIAPHLPLELDFRNEGRNAERAAADLAKTGLNCVVPKILWNYSSSRVLVMEFEEGFKATDIEKIEEAGLKRRDVAKLISSVFSSQVFLSAFVHCDPHPANVLLRRKPDGKPEMVLVDHGLYRGLNDGFRRRYSVLWKSLMLADLDGIRNACHSLGIDEAYTLFAAMLTARPYDEMIERSKKTGVTASLGHAGSPAGSRADKAVIRGYAQRFIHDIFGLLSNLPRQMLLLLKMNDCLRHIDYSLGSPTNTMVVCGQFAARAIYEDSLRESRSWAEKFRAWFSYMQVLTRIQIHDMVVWWLESKNDIFRL